MYRLKNKGRNFNLSFSLYFFLCKGFVLKKSKTIYKEKGWGKFMDYFDVNKRKIKWEKLKLDFELTVLLIALLGIGTSFIFSASSVLSIQEEGHPYYFFNRHLFNLFVGIVVALVVSKIRYQSLRGYVPILNLVAVVLSLLLFVDKFNLTINGATRWISLFGFSFQPSEFIKITMILTLAHIIDMKKRANSLDKFKEGMLPIILYIGVFVSFVILQKHLSAIGIILLVALSIIIVSGVKKIYLLFLGSIVLCIGVLGVILEPFRMLRLFSFMNPYADPTGSGFHIIQSWRAFGSGELFGLGLGMSRQKFGWLPENHTDFILAIIGEEFGFLGLLLIFVLFLLFILRGLWISTNAPDFYGQLVAFGITSLIFFQTIINIFVVSGLFPVTGMPLPFISYGGTSTMILLFSIGILLNIASQKEKK